jgi:ribosomal protein L37AE/L43A
MATHEQRFATHQAFASCRRSVADAKSEAPARGYEQEACLECGSFTLVRNGTHIKCDTCGTSSGGNEHPFDKDKLPPIGSVEGPKGSFS